MPDPTPVAARLRQKLTEHSINGWTLAAHFDGVDGEGVPTYWHEWQHEDGRRAMEWADGRCSDQELEALLRVRSGTGFFRGCSSW